MFFKLVIKAMWQGRMKTLLVMAVSSVAIATSASLLGLVYDVRSQMQNELKAFGPNFVIRPRPSLDSPEGRVGRGGWGSGGEGISEEQFLKVKEVMGDAVLSPHILGTAKLRGEAVLVSWLKFESQRQLSRHWEVLGDWALRRGEAMVGQKLAQKFGFRLGEKMKFDEGSGESFLIRGIFRSGSREDDQILLSLEDAHRLFGDSVLISTVEARVHGSLSDLEALSKRMGRMWPQLRSSPILRVARSEGQVLDRIEALIWLVNFLIFAMTALTVMTASTALVWERREEFALARVLGASGRRLAVLFYAQHVLSCLAASPLGFFLGYVAWGKLARHLFGAQATFRWELVPVVLASMVLVVLLGGGIAVKRISAIEPALVLKGE